MPEALLSKLVPNPPDFPEALSEYCEIAADAIRRNKHHDDRRKNLLCFLQAALGIETYEVELEHKIKAGAVRGRIDAFYRECIIEIKCDLEREREAARRELTKYFAKKAAASEKARVSAEEGNQFIIELEAVAPNSTIKGIIWYSHVASQIRSESLEQNKVTIAHEDGALSRDFSEDEFCLK